jgi:hypothetical protein
MATQTSPVEKTLTNGRAAAAILAGGIGTAVLGVIVLLSELSTPIANALNWMNPVGPLSGKVFLTIVLFFGSWLGLHFLWKDKDVNIGRIVAIAFILLAVGIVLTFPPVWGIFKGG